MDSEDEEENLAHCVQNMQGAQDSDSDSDSDTEPYHNIVDHDEAWRQVRNMYETTGNCPKALVRRLQTLADEHDRNVVERYTKASEDRRDPELPTGQGLFKENPGLSDELPGGLTALRKCRFSG